MLLLAQLVAPTLQPGPVRLPAVPPADIQPSPVSPISPPTPSPLPPDLPPSDITAPAVQGFIPYSSAALAQILAGCRALPSPQERLQACAAALSARLFSDGYINSRVQIQPDPAPGVLLIKPGRIERIDVVSASAALRQRISRIIHPLQGQVIHLPTLTANLTQLQRLPGVGRLRTSLNRVARDSTRGVLLITVDPASQGLRGEFSLRNDGNAGSGQFRGLGTVVQSSLLRSGDTLLLFGEVNTDSDPELGYSSMSLSYSLPIVEPLSFTLATGLSRRNLVEAEEPLRDLSYRQLQLFGQFDYTFAESLRDRLSGFVGLSFNRSDAFLAGDRAPVIAGGGDDAWLRSGYVRFGVGYEMVRQGFVLETSLYGLQGIGAISTSGQLDELAFLGVVPEDARAIGAQTSLSWLVVPGWLLNLRVAGQGAFEPLTNAMGFSLGSDNGLRGLPGQAISGDSGVLGSAELAWTFWSRPSDSLQLVPFLGAGKVWTEVPGATLTDSIGAGGVLLRWSRGRHAELELGWVRQFQAESRAFWDNWILGNGLYSKVVYRF